MIKKQLRGNEDGKKMMKGVNQAAMESYDLDHMNFDENK
jgi:hypothetical protein